MVLTVWLSVGGPCLAGAEFGTAKFDSVAMMSNPRTPSFDFFRLLSRTDQQKELSYFLVRSQSVGREVEHEVEWEPCFGAVRLLTLIHRKGTQTNTEERLLVSL